MKIKTLQQFLIPKLRRAWLQHPPRNQAKIDARISRGLYQCAKCKLEFKSKEVEVHHIHPINKFENWEIFIERLFCEKGDLMVLCKSCHKQTHQTCPKSSI